MSSPQGVDIHKGIPVKQHEYIYYISCPWLRILHYMYCNVEEMHLVLLQRLSLFEANLL